MKRPTFHRPWLGRVTSLKVQRLGLPGVWLGDGEPDANGESHAILLPRSEVPEGTKQGDPMDVFVYLDSDDRPIATLKTPKVELDEVSFLEVKDVAPFGAFVDWGLTKQLLVPRAEQTCVMSVGQRHPIGLYVDDSGRLAGTMRVSEKLQAAAPVAVGDWVLGEAWRNDPRIGLFVIVERRFVGLLPAEEPHPLHKGDAARFRVAAVLDDGKIRLSLRGLALDERANDAERIWEALRANPRLRVGDHTSPAQIRAQFGVSKKAFKRAIGLLLKDRKISFDDDGNIVVPRKRRIIG